MNAEKLLRHMAWANEAVFKEVEELPDEALGYYLSDPHWNVGEILMHICDAATWYSWCLRDSAESTKESEKNWDRRLEDSRVRPKISTDIQNLRSLVNRADTELLEAANAPDELLTVELDEKPYECARSTVISEAVHHATEHRTQLVAALEANGYKFINLDKYHLWGFRDL